MSIYHPKRTRKERFLIILRAFRMYWLIGSFLAQWSIVFPIGYIVSLVCICFWLLGSRKSKEEIEYERLTWELERSISGKSLQK